MTSEPEYVDPSQLRPGPIREQFEIDFMRDMHPEDEVVIWCSITAAWLEYHEKHLGGEVLPDDDEKKLLAALISISTCVKDVDALGVPPEVGRKLLECYDELSDE